MICISTMYRTTRKRWQWSSNSIRTKHSVISATISYQIAETGLIHVFREEMNMPNTLKIFPKAWGLTSAQYFVFWRLASWSKHLIYSGKRVRSWPRHSVILPLHFLLKFSGTKHWAARLVTLDRRPDRFHILLSSFWKTKQKRCWVKQGQIL